MARSTLYSHFDDRDSLLLEAMNGPLSILAAATVGNDQPEKLVALLQHFWDQRRGAADVLDGALAKRIIRSLGTLLMAHDDTLERADALRIADSLLGYVRLWIFGETPTTPELLAQKMIASAKAQRAALQR